MNRAVHEPHLTGEPATGAPAGKPWGWDAGIDLAGGDPAVLTDETKVTAFLADLVDAINMEAYGAPWLVPFGKGVLHGLTAVQLIETSDITFHEAAGQALITVFSCKEFDPDVAAQVAVKHFGGEVTVNLRLRGQASA